MTKAAATNKPRGSQGQTGRSASLRGSSHAKGDVLATARLRFAMAELERSGALVGARSLKLSTRVDPGLIEAARRRTGLRSDSDLINAALAVIAAGDDFGTWLIGQAGRLPEDFELAL